MVAALVPKPLRNHPAFVKILASNDQLTAESDHRGVFLRRIPFGDDDQSRNTDLRSRDGNGLAMVAARGRD